MPIARLCLAIFEFFCFKDVRGRIRDRKLMIFVGKLPQITEIAELNPDFLQCDRNVCSLNFDLKIRSTFLCSEKKQAKHISNNRFSIFSILILQ